MPVNKISRLLLKEAFIFLSFLLFTPMASSNEEITEDSPVVIVDQTSQTLTTIESFVLLKQQLQNDIKVLNKQVDRAKTSEEKSELKVQLDKLQGNLRTTSQHLKEIAAGIDISVLEDQTEEAFNFQEEFFSLLKPAIDEMKEMTSQVRKKSELKENITFLSLRLPVLTQAIENISELQKKNKNRSVRSALKAINKQWGKKQALLQSELKAHQLQLDKILAAEAALADSSHSYLKTFFQKRGLYLGEAIVSILIVILLSKLTLSSMRRLLPGFKAKRRSFHIRLIELLHRLITLFMIVLGPMVVFYLVEDWVLFSLGILLLFGMAWTIRLALPRYWHQIYIFLNIGSVREGERILLNDLPWRVEKINVFCKLINPVAELTLRIPLNDLVDLTSRPVEQDEPWFPCKKNDWVLLSDGIRGKVTGISIEMVQLIERGGARKVYQTREFLNYSPRNLSTNFRLKETIGISYSLQKQSTTEIPNLLHEFILLKANAEGYSEQLLNLRVEFESANSSSLDIVMIADFSGDAADLYNRLRRALQRWGVEACTENNWEIPFPQLTLHKT